MKEQIEKFRKTFTVLFIFSSFFAMCGVNSSGADSTVRTNTPQSKLPQVKTTFVDDAKLNEQEVKDVVSLARQCGIDQPAEVSTFHYRPIGGKGISVKSVERVKGVDITIDEISIEKIGWTEFERDKNCQKGGKFPCDAI